MKTAEDDCGFGAGCIPNGRRHAESEGVMTDRELMQEMLDFLVGGDFAYSTRLATDLRESH